VESLKRYKMALTIAGLGSALLLTVFLLFYFGVFSLPDEPRRLVDAGILFAGLVLFSLWGIFLLYRMPNNVAWTLFLWLLLLTQLWLFSGFLKRFTAREGLADRFFWHLSYGPMLFMPVLWLCLVLSDFTRLKIKSIVILLDSLSAAFFLLIMLNDLHHWAWTPIYDEAGVIKDWKSGPLYFVAALYIFLLLFLSVFHLIYGTLNKRNHWKEVLLLLVPLALLLSYSILYFLGVPWLRKTPVINNYYIMDSFFGFLLMEVALQSGLVQNAGFYRSFFIKGPFHLALAYPDYRLFERNEGFTMIEDIKAKEEVVQGGKRYRKKAVEGGYLLLEEDIGDLLRLQAELLAKQKELQQTMRLLEGREKVEAEVERYNVRSQLNESLFSEIELESDAIEKLVASLPDGLTPASRQACSKTLESLQNRLAFLKQRCLFFISAEGKSGLSYADFALSQGSLNRDLANVGFLVAVHYPAFVFLPLPSALKINAFLRSLIEAFGDSRGGILLSFDPDKGSVKARILPTPEFDLSHVLFSPQVEQEEEGYRLSLDLKA
jgi:hypothetical protein